VSGDLGTGGAGEKPREDPMVIGRGNSPMPLEMKELLKKKDKEIESMRELMGSWGNLNLLRRRLEETKGQLGWNRIKELGVTLEKKEKDIDCMRERMGEYERAFRELQQESLERLRAVEKVITTPGWTNSSHSHTPTVQSLRITRSKASTTNLHLFGRLTASNWPPDCWDAIHHLVAQSQTRRRML